MSRKGGQRPLRPGEKALWDKVTATIHHRTAEDPPLPEVTEDLETLLKTGPHPKGEPPLSRRFKPQLPSSLIPKSLNTGPKSPSGQRLNAGDPGLGKRVAKGRTPIDATLDLHGYSQEEARMRLGHFVEFAALRQNRVLLIITGKGPPGGEDHRPFGDAPRGILRQRFLEWIEQPPLRDRISSVRQSHQRHGGRGAFYVFLTSRGT